MSDQWKGIPAHDVIAVHESLGVEPPAGYVTREAHLAWCKERALEYVDAGDIHTAYASMASDLSKHDETADHPGIVLGMTLLMTGNLATAEQMRDHIEGYN